MYAVEFYIFAALVLTAAFLSVTVRPILYAAFCQVQAVVAVAGILAGLNAKFVSFALLSMTAASMLVFLMFALIVFDFHQLQKTVPQKASVTSLTFFVLLCLQTAYLFFKPQWPIKKSAPDFSLPVLGNILYADYGLCVVIFAALVLSCMVGISALLVRKKKENGGNA
ncbi:MAG: NADH-quinone oxidoreductase subunit J [Alphaproteobacteria bacterium]|nr:NADH-quinone oxidoreductase subunit J [Alphaproteobacteria bacterium]